MPGKSIWRAAHDSTYAKIVFNPDHVAVQQDQEIEKERLSKKDVHCVRHKRVTNEFGTFR